MTPETTPHPLPPSQTAKEASRPLLDYRIVSVIITILVPFMLIMTSVAFFPIFAQIEYRLPNFPADNYGFTLADRLKWSGISINYMLNNQGISFLADQRLPDGQPLYNQRELSHMSDVKNLVQATIKAWVIGVAILLLAGIWAWRSQWLSMYRLAISNGGWLAVALIISILVGVAISFNTLFTDFHRLFFTGDSWLFLYTDSLIRLFPIRFWQDVFITLGALALSGGLALGFFVRPRRTAR
jgi:integral membrane protein (TIGR01906 family)